MPTLKQDYQIRRDGVPFIRLTYVRVVQVLHYSYFPKELCNTGKAMEGGEGGRGGKEGRREEKEGGGERGRRGKEEREGGREKGTREERGREWLKHVQNLQKCTYLPFTITGKPLTGSHLPI